MGLMVAFTKVSVNTEADVLKTAAVSVDSTTPSSSSEAVVEEVAQDTPVEEVALVEEEPVAEEVAAEQPVATEEVYTTNTESQVTAASGYSLTNGNTAGEVGTEAAAQMAAATGVPQSTWEYIIARESNGNASVSNASGASGLFQTMPGWGSTATVQDQVNAAINAYNSQGLSAWGL
ncbi:transglycosylase SLT domain-containing protein [Streptococcus sp. DD12]|uniref:transglycosylase SLT domain-containing protein n=1 Tax=Streptococcus sp. DD12 TaxID=1777880 RepID=UPI0007974A52|nr:transglycosylase SLT domain-containing protein [Streptococcus sp. DD12]KXT76095.1 Immunodominant antigen A [Streptococcus sp. DD12]